MNGARGSATALGITACQFWLIFACLGLTSRVGWEGRGTGPEFGGQQSPRGGMGWRLPAERFARHPLWPGLSAARSGRPGPCPPEGGGSTDLCPRSVLQPEGRWVLATLQRQVETWPVVQPAAVWGIPPRALALPCPGVCILWKALWLPGPRGAEAVRVSDKGVSLRVSDKPLGGVTTAGFGGRGLGWLLDLDASEERRQGCVPTGSQSGARQSSCCGSRAQAVPDQASFSW